MTDAQAKQKGDAIEVGEPALCVSQALSELKRQALILSWS